jgi:hypothetical protein
MAIVRRPDQRLIGTSVSGAGPAPSGNVLQARQIIISGTGEGLFIYEGTPGAGNPPVAFATAGGVTKDPYGNTLPGLPVAAGSFVVTGPGELVQLADGAIFLEATSAPAGAQPADMSVDGTPGFLEISSGSASASDEPTELLINSGSLGGALQVSSGADGSTYDTMRLTLETAVPLNVDSTTPVTLFTFPVAVGTYAYQLEIPMLGTGTAIPQIRFSSAAAVVSSMQGETVLDGGTAGGYTAFQTALNTFGPVGPPLVNGDANDLNGSGIFTFTTAGTIAVQMNATTAAAAATIPAGARMHLLPVTGLAGSGGGGAGANSKLIFVIPSGDATGATDGVKVNAILADGNTPWLTPGIYYDNVGVSTDIPQQFIFGSGRWNTLWNFLGTGDAFRMYNPTYGGGGFWGGGLKGFTIDGTGGTAPMNLVHVGDMSQLELDIAVQNATGGGCFGVLLDNTIWFTEEYHGTIWARNCDTHVGFNVSGAAKTATNSFAYGDLTCYIQAQPGQDGVAVQNGAYPYHGGLHIRDNFQGSSSAVTNAVLRITGQVPAGFPQAGEYSAIYGHNLDIQVECAAAAFTPYTIYFGTVDGNYIDGCQGIMDFTQGAGTFTPSNVVVPADVPSLGYSGRITGDPNLSGNDTWPIETSSTSRGYGRSFMSAANGNVFTNHGDFFQLTLTGDTTVNLGHAGQGVAGAAQRKTFRILQAATGGPYTLTWPDPAIPTPLAPAVRWAGGAVPAMSTGASAEDWYFLETYDGLVWVGRATQNVS